MIRKITPAVQLALNGKPVYLNNITISASVKRDDPDMSGQKSSTKKTDKGVKAKELNVSGLIPYRYKEWLTDLFNLAEAENAKGEQEKYRVSCMLAEVINMREVQFSGAVNVNPEGGKLAWAVSFTLKEINSVAEKKDQRKPKPAVKVQSEQAPTAQPQAQQPPQDTQQAPAKEDNSWSAKINDFIGS